MHPFLVSHPLAHSRLPSTLISILKQKPLIRHFQASSCSVSWRHLNLTLLLPSLETLSSLGFCAPITPPLSAFPATMLSHSPLLGPLILQFLKAQFVLITSLPMPPVFGREAQTHARHLYALDSQLSLSSLTLFSELTHMTS